MIPKDLAHQAIAEMLALGIEYVSGASVDGDVVEFGCMTGRTANVLAEAMSSFPSIRKLHLFDSFQGLPESTSPSDQQSFHVKEGLWAKGTCQGITPSTLRDQCRQYLDDSRVMIYEGWFGDTISSIPDGTSFALLHVDCDLYQSTMDAIDYVFQKRMVAEGAMILFDDWNCNRASNEFGERKAWKELVSKHQILFDDVGDYACFGHKFIVHSCST